MDFNDTQEEAAFRAEAAAWLKANVPTSDELAGLDDIAAAKLCRHANCTSAQARPACYRACKSGATVQQARTACSKLSKHAIIPYEK